MAETKTTKTKKCTLFPNEPRVTINIPFNRFEKEDVWVAVNGKSVQIKRGMDVEVPRCIAEAIKHSDDMMIEAIEFQEKATGRASAKELE